jgi:hypothetical protein
MTTIGQCIMQHLRRKVRNGRNSKPKPMTKTLFLNYCYMKFQGKRIYVEGNSLNPVGRGRWVGGGVVERYRQMAFMLSWTVGIWIVLYLSATANSTIMATSLPFLSVFRLCVPGRRFVCVRRAGS